jgi:hypothetical protein
MNVFPQLCMLQVTQGDLLMQSRWAQICEVAAGMWYEV